MNLVRVIGCPLARMMMGLTYLFLYKESLSSFLKINFSIWYSWISMECWIKHVHYNIKMRAIWLMKQWACLSLFGICMYATKYWEVTEDDLKKGFSFGSDILFFETHYDG